MAMLKSYTCSKCAGVLLFDSDQEFFDCPFCGTKFSAADFHGNEIMDQAKDCQRKRSFDAAKEKYYAVLENDPDNYILQDRDTVTEDNATAEDVVNDTDNGYKKTYEGYIGDSYKTEEKQIEGYDIVKNKDIYTAEELENKGLNAEDKYIPENSEGNMENTKTEVDYYYIRKTTIKVEYIDKNTGELITQEIPIEEGHEGDLYETEEKEFEDYKLVIVPEDKEGVMEVEKDEDGNVISTEKVIKYYYVYKSAGVIEKHIDLETGEPIEEEKKYTGYEGDEYEIKPKEIKGYEIVEEKLPENSKGTMDREGIEVIYYYKKVKEETPEPTKEIPEQNTDDGNSNNNLTDSNGRTTIINNNYPTERDRNTDSSSNNTKILATPSYISLDNTNDINNSNNSKFNESKQQEKMVETPSAGDNLPVAVFNIVIALIVLNTLITLVASKNKK